MIRMLTIAVLLCWCGGAWGSEEPHLVRLSDGSDWICGEIYDESQRQTWHQCGGINVASGGVQYLRLEPLTEESLKSYLAYEERRGEEAMCACSREIPWATSCKPEPSDFITIMCWLRDAIR